MLFLKGPLVCGWRLLIYVSNGATPICRNFVPFTVQTVGFSVGLVTLITNSSFHRKDFIKYFLLFYLLPTQESNSVQVLKIAYLKWFSNLSFRPPLNHQYFWQVKLAFSRKKGHLKNMGEKTCLKQLLWQH